jgi:hypothetical protein
MLEENGTNGLDVVENDGFGSDLPEEETVEPESEGEQEASDVEEPIKQVRTTTPEKTKYNREKRKSKELEHKVRQLEEEITRQKQIAEKSSEIAMSQYDRTVQLDMDRAKSKLTKALEDGDISVQTEMTAELALLAAKAEQLNVWKSQKQIDEDNRQPTQINRGQQSQVQQVNEDYEPEEIDNPIMAKWMSDNTWFNQNSDDFDPEMYEEVLGFATAYDKKLARTGQTDKIGTKEYFDDINNYVRSEFYSDPQPTHSRTLNMKQSNTPVAPVGNGAQRAKSSKSTVSLNSEEKAFAVTMGLTEAEFLDFKVKDMENQRLKGKA